MVKDNDIVRKCNEITAGVEMAAATGGDTRVTGERVQDATMMDVGEKDRLTGDPPDVPMTWVRKVVGSSVGGMPVPEEILDEEFVAARLCLDFPDGEDGEPVITIGAEVLEAMNGMWKNCILVKVLGRHSSIAVLSKKLRELWKPIGAMYVMDLPRQFFMVRFEKEEEYLEALTGGPWRVFGSYLMVQGWSPEFDPMRDEIVTTPVWVRLASIPVNFYHKSILMGIAKGLGKPIKVDLTTLNFERARFARVCVEVNLKKPLKGSVVINGERYYVAYEGLTNICSSCGVYGHLVHNCPREIQARAAVVVQTSAPIERAVVSSAQTADGFTMVGKSGRRSEQQRRKIGSSSGNTGVYLGNNRRDLGTSQDLRNISLSNSFGTLREDLADPNLREVAVVPEENKENHNTVNQLEQNVHVAQENLVRFGTHLNNNKEGAQMMKEKRAGGTKNMDASGPRPKVSKPVRPARGLVFGPTREEVELSKSGKRLRVEKTKPGRLGGCFANNRDATPEEERLEQGQMEAGSGESLVSGRNPPQMEEALQLASPEMVNGGRVA